VGGGALSRAAGEGREGGFIATITTVPTKTNDPAARPMVFISYSHKDKEWLDELNTMLAPLAGKAVVEVWADTAIEPSGWESPQRGRRQWEWAWPCSRG